MKDKKVKSDTKVEEFRKDRFLEMGFGPDDAVALSRARDSKTRLFVDKYEVQKILDQGCTKELAVKIFV